MDNPHTVQSLTPARQRYAGTFLLVSIGKKNGHFHRTKKRATLVDSDKLSWAVAKAWIIVMSQDASASSAQTKKMWPNTRRCQSFWHELLTSVSVRPRLTDPEVSHKDTEYLFFSLVIKGKVLKFDLEKYFENQKSWRKTWNLKKDETLHPLRQSFSLEQELKAHEIFENFYDGRKFPNWPHLTLTQLSQL